MLCVCEVTKLSSIGFFTFSNIFIFQKVSILVDIPAGSSTDVFFFVTCEFPVVDVPDSDGYHFIEFIIPHHWERLLVYFLFKRTN